MDLFILLIEQGSQKIAIFVSLVSMIVGFFGNFRYVYSMHVVVSFLGCQK